MTASQAPLSAPLEVGFDYTRSLGPTLGRFMTALAQRRVLGIRGSDGRVHVPPAEYDPVTSEPLTDFVEVGTEGTVTTWSWMPEPLAGQPLQHPFAWAMVRLDGADTPMLHAVDAGSPEVMRTGMRVRVRWATQTGPRPHPPAGGRGAPPPLLCPRPHPPAGGRGAGPPPSGGGIRDIACFEPIDAPPAAPAEPAEPPERVDMITTPVELTIQHSVSPEESRYLRGLAEGRLLGQRCPACRKVYIPPRGACPTDGVPTVEEIELPDRGTVTTFCIVNVPFLGQRIAPPYVAAYILLDGADIAFLHLVLGVPAEEVRMGIRVQAVWKPREEWGTTPANIDHFRPTGEPDAPFDSYAQHL